MGIRRPAGRFLIFSRAVSASALAAFAILSLLLRETSGLSALPTAELAASAVVCALHCIDKSAAAAGAWRVPEKLLLALTLLSGGAAPWLTRQLIRHKTAREHRYFALCEAAALAIHAALWIVPGII